VNFRRQAFGGEYAFFYAEINGHVLHRDHGHGETNFV
jgi:hypothetical protein